MSINKTYQREFESSPSFQWTNAGTILTTKDFNVSWESQDANSIKYLPFNFTRIINNSSYDIIFYPNQDANNPITVPSGTIQSIDKRTLPAVHSFKIKNNGTGSITAGQIVITNSREGQTGDSIVERLHKRLFNKLPKGQLW